MRGPVSGFGSSAMLPGGSGRGPVVDTTLPVASSASIVMVCWLVLKFCATQSTERADRSATGGVERERLGRDRQGGQLPCAGERDIEDAVPEAAVGGLGALAHRDDLG